jgi:hypothetical protein
MMRSLSTSAFGQPSETKLTLGARNVCGEGCGFSMPEGLPERVVGSKPARSHAAFISSAADECASGSSSLNFHDFRLYGDRCSRPSFRPRMYRRERGRDQRRPAGRNPWRVFICPVAHSRLPAAAPVPARIRAVPRRFPPVRGKIGRSGIYIRLQMNPAGGWRD